MVEQIKVTEVPHHVLGKFDDVDNIPFTPIGQDRILIRPAGFTCQIGPKGVADKRYKADYGWNEPVARLDDETMVVYVGDTNYESGSYLYAAVIRDDQDVPSDLVADSFQWDNKRYTVGYPEYVNWNETIPAVPKYGFEKIFDPLWLPEWWQAVPAGTRISCYMFHNRFWRDKDNPNTVYWIGEVEGLRGSYPNWYSYGANYLFRFFLDANNNITPDSSFVVQLGASWEGPSGGSPRNWGPGEAGSLTNSLFWVRSRFTDESTYGNFKDSIRVYDYSGNLADETPALYPQTNEYSNDPDYEYGYALVRQGSDGDLVVALQRAHSHESPPEYQYSGYMIETWLEIERWSWNGSSLQKIKSVTVDYSYAGDDSYFWDIYEWKPGWWTVTPDKCLSPPIPYGAPGFGTDELARQLRFLIMDNDFNITHSWSPPTLNNRSDVNDNEDERLHFFAWSAGVLGPMITKEGNGILGWSWYDEWGQYALYDAIPQLYHFSLYDTGEQTIDPVWGKHGEIVKWDKPKNAYPQYSNKTAQIVGKDPWNDESIETYTQGSIWGQYWYDSIHYAELHIPEERSSLLDVVGIKLTITVQNTAPSLMHWQWYLEEIYVPGAPGNISFGDYGVPIGPGEISTYEEIYNDHIFRNVDNDGVYWPRKMVPDPTDVYGYGWTLPDGPYSYWSGSWGGQWGGYAPASLPMMKHIMKDRGISLEISPDTGYDDEDPEFDFTPYHLRVLNVKLELITGNQPKRATYINKASTGTAPNWVNVCPVEGVATAYPVTIQQAGAYAEIAGTGSIWYDGSDDTYAIVGTINNSLSRLEVQIPSTPAFTSTSAVTLHLRAEANHTTSTGVQMIFAMYSQPWDGNGTGFLGSFRTGTSSFAFIPEGGIQNMTLTMANFYDSAIYSALQAGGVYLYAYGSTTGTTNYWVKIYEAQVYVNGEAVAPEIVGASGADNRLNIGDDATQDWRPMHFDWTGGGFNKWQPVRFNVSTDGGQDWYVACPHAYGWE